METAKVDIGKLFYRIESMLLDYKDLDLLFDEEDKRTFNYLNFDNSVRNLKQTAKEIKEKLTS